MKRTFFLVHDHARQNAVEAVKTAPDGYCVEVKQRTRSLDQNAKFHKLCEIASQNATYMGRKFSLLQWKTLFVSGHSIATEGQAEIIPGLEGEFVNVRESTASMSRTRKSSLIEYTQAYLAGLGIDLNGAGE